MIKKKIFIDWIDTRGIVGLEERDTFIILPPAINITTLIHPLQQNPSLHC